MENRTIGTASGLETGLRIQKYRKTQKIRKNSLFTYFSVNNDLST